MRPFAVIVILLVILGWFAPCQAIDSPGMAVVVTDAGNPFDVVETDADPAVSDPVQVTIVSGDDGFQLLRNGEPYFIKGVGGHRYLESAAAAGANAVRTWDTADADRLLARAHRLGMTVMLGIWLSHDPADYHDPDYREQLAGKVTALVERLKRHPALLCWSLGNEINLQGADTETAWRFVDQLTGMIKQRDPNHPVISVIAGKAATLDHIAAWAPSLDAVGINVYGGLGHLRAAIDASAYQGPYLVTEWGVQGHWEAAHTRWGRPIEPTSAWKAEFQLAGYRQHILGNRDRCLGAYVFLWGQKQERTPTWYSLVLDNLPGLASGEALFSAPVDVMHYNWTGRWPANRSPEVAGMQINDQVADGNIVVAPGRPIVSRVEARDRDNDPLTYVWELLEEPTRLSIGGAYEPCPARLAFATRAQTPVLEMPAPLRPGEYRLFVYILDHQGHAATANIPFKVQSDQEQVHHQAGSDPQPSG